MSTEQGFMILIGLVLAILSWMLIREMRRLESVEQKVVDIAAQQEKNLRDLVTHPQFERKLEEIDRHRMVLHAENAKKLDAIADTTTKIYSQAIDIGRMEERLRQLEDRRDYLDDWKHKTVDPYIPRAVDEHDRRIEELERRFNDARIGRA